MRLDCGGHLAVWCEHGVGTAPPGTGGALPWLVLHGGPGGGLSAAHVAPLRLAGLPWFGFDQRNSGLSEDLDLSQLDLQRFIDDALELADALQIPRFHLLGGSWGGTLALALAAYRPERVCSMVLRAPFVPSMPRVNAFFEALEHLDPDRFANAFTAGARTLQVCDAMLNASPEQAITMARCWRDLELALLAGRSAAHPQSKVFLSDVQELMLVRKYRLQAWFLLHECFVSGNDWNSMLLQLQQARIPTSLVQGSEDRICPPGGAQMLAEIMPWADLVEVQGAGHLPDDPLIRDAVLGVVKRHALPAQ